MSPVDPTNAPRPDAPRPAPPRPDVVPASRPAGVDADAVDAADAPDAAPPRTPRPDAPASARDWFDSDDGFDARERPPAGLIARLDAFVDHALTYLGTDAMPRMAAALSYRTIFSLIPILVLALLIFRLSQDQSQLREFLGRLLDQIGLSQIATGDQGEANVQKWITDLVDRFSKINFTGIGLVSAATLIYAAISLLVEVEHSFNTVYGAARGRSWVKRVLQYWMIVTLGPLLLYAGFAAADWFTAAAKSFAGFSEVMGPPAPGQSVKPPDPGRARAIMAIGYASTVVISSALLLVLYVTVPNTLVRLRPAVWGALAGGLLLELAKYGFALYVAEAGSKSLYGSLALLPLFLLWVYVTWFIVLFGLRVAFLIQHGKRSVLLGALRASAAGRGSLAGAWVEPARSVSIVVGVAEGFRDGLPPRASRLAEKAGLDERTTKILLHRLEDAGVVLRIASEGREDSYTLARPPERITADEIVSVGQSLSGPAGPGAEGEVIARVRAAQRQAVEGVTLASLLSSGRRRARANPAPANPPANPPASPPGTPAAAPATTPAAPAAPEPADATPPSPPTVQPT